MKHLATIALAMALAPLAASGQAPAPYQSSQFVDMFNGKDLSGWVNINTAEDTWKTHDGMVICSEGGEIHFRNMRLLELAPGVTSAEQTAPERK